MDRDKFVKFAVIMKERFEGAEINQISVLIAYYLLLSMFPLMIAIGNLIPYFNIDPHVVMEYIAVIVPLDVMPVLEPIVYNLLTSANGGLLSLSILGAIWSASRGITYLQKGVNKAYGVLAKGNVVVKRIISIISILALMIILVALVLVFSIGELVLTKLEPLLPWAHSVMDWLPDVKWPVSLAFIFASMMVIYRITPDVRLKIKDVWPGTVLSTVGLMILVQGFTIYLQFITRALSSYGTLGTFFVLMFWLNFSAIIVVTGAVLNASLFELKYGKPTLTLGPVDHVIERGRYNLLQKIQNRFHAFGKAQPPPQAEEQESQEQDHTES